jgi:type I restriction enzyme, S subunit
LGLVADLCLGKMLDQKKNRGEPLPYLGNVNVRWGGFSLDDLRTMRFENKEMERYGLKFGDIVMCEGGEPGRCAIWTDQVPGMMIQKALHRIRPKDILNYRFLFYSFLHIGYSRGFDQYFTGATIKHLPGEKLAKLEVDIPPLPVQQRIADVLSVYDELIENVKQRVRILETIAKSLYREWFINFRFPGHEKIPRVPVLGDIPKGWKAISFDELLVSMTGGDWGSEQSTEDETADVCVVRGTDLDELAYGGQLRAPIRFIKHSSLQSRQLRLGDVIVENSINAKSRCIGTTLLVDNGVLTRIGRSAIAASFCKVFRLRDPTLAPLVHLHFRRLREDGKMEYYQNIAANGIGNFQAQRFAKNEYLVLPIEQSLRSRLTENLAVLFEEVSVLASKIANLRRTRDLLLPRLLSGQLLPEAA